MSDLVKTKEKIWWDAEKQNNDGTWTDESLAQKYLVFPSGLDVLEEMLKEKFWLKANVTISNHAIKIISSIFARFKKENGL